MVDYVFFSQYPVSVDSFLFVSSPLHRDRKLISWKFCNNSVYMKVTIMTSTFFLLIFGAAVSMKRVGKKVFQRVPSFTHEHTHTLAGLGNNTKWTWKRNYSFVILFGRNGREKKMVFHWSSEWCGVFLRVPRGDKVYNWIWRWGYKRKVIFHKIKIERQNELRPWAEGRAWRWREVKMSLTITTSLKIFVCEWNLNIKKEPRKRELF